MSMHELFPKMRRVLSLALCAVLLFSVTLSLPMSVFAEDEEPVIEEIEIEEAPVEEAAPAPAEQPEEEAAPTEEAAPAPKQDQGDDDLPEMDAVIEEDDTLALPEMDSDSDTHNAILLDIDRFTIGGHHPYGQTVHLYFKLYSFGVYSGEYYRVYLYDASGTRIANYRRDFVDAKGVRTLDLSWDPGTKTGLFYVGFEAFPKVASTDGQKYPFYIDTPVVSNPRIASVDTLNNQCIRVAFDRSVSGGSNVSNYVIRNVNGSRVSISSASYVSGNVYQLNFSSPIDAGNYHLQFGNGSVGAEADFRIYLDLRVWKIVDDRNVIIQLSDAIIGCTTPSNYVFHTLSGQVINITSAVSAYAEQNGAAPNIFRLTTDQTLRAGTTYVVETRNMYQGPNACQGTIAYFTPTESQLYNGCRVNVTSLTNNQSIRVQLPTAVGGITNPNNFVITGSSNNRVSVGNVQSIGYNAYEINFTAPLKADHYTIHSQSMSESLTGSFDITLDLSIVRIDGNSVIIQLNEPIYGCTTPNNYFVHKLGSSQQIVASDAYSVFTELGSTMPNVFRIVLPQWIEQGQTYIIETRAMSLDAAGNQPCQGTIAYFTK